MYRQLQLLRKMGKQDYEPRKVVVQVVAFVCEFAFVFVGKRSFVGDGRQLAIWLLTDGRL